MSLIADQMPIVEQSPTDAEFIQNPYDFYCHIRSLGDFVYWKDYELPVATTVSAVNQVLKHPKLGRAFPKDQVRKDPNHLAQFNAVERYSLFELEPPDHSRIRRIAAKGFGRSEMATMAPTISRITDSVIDAFPTDQPFDLTKLFAKPIAAQSVAAFMGIEKIHARQMQHWSNSMVAMYQARRDTAAELAAAEAAENFRIFVSDYITSYGKGETYIGGLIAAEEAGELVRDEVISTFIMMFNAGQEATAQAIGNSIRLLMDHPERSLALHPEQIANTVEECLRFEPPQHLFKRYVYEPVTILGMKLPMGSEVGCLLGSSCRDDAVWPDGEKFDPLRAPRDHQAFGAGLHECLSASLARLEMQIALPALFSRCPNLTITEPTTFANLYHFRTLEKLMVQIR